MTRHGRELGVFTACAAVVVACLFRDAILSGAVLGQADLLYQFPPWNGHAPPGWRPGNPLLLDSPTQFVPFLMEAKTAIFQGRWPLWTNAAGAGQPFLAAFQTAVLSPFTLFAYLLPIPQALTPMAAARLLVGGIGMFVFLRSLPLGLAASAFGGLAFLLNPFSVAWLEHPHAGAAAWLPWALLTARNCVQRPSRWATAAMAAVTAAALLSGHPETAFKVFLLAGAYALYLSAGAPRPLVGLASAASGVLLGTVISAIQLVPFLEYLAESRILATRAEATLPLFTNPPVSFVTAFVPDFFGTPMSRRYVLDSTNYLEQTTYPGLVTWVLAIAALAARRRGPVLFFGGAAVASALIMYGTPVASAATAVIPPLKVAALSRFGLLVIAGLIVTAALGLQTLIGDGTRTQQGRTPWMLAGIASAAIVTVVLACLWLERPMLQDARQFAATIRSVQVAGVLLAGSLAGLWLAALSPSGARPFIVGAVIAADLLMFADGLHPLRSPRDTFPAVAELEVVRGDRDLFRVAGWQDALYPNSAVAYGLQDYRGFDAVGVRTYASLLDVGFAFNGAFHALRHFATPHLLDLLNVKYVITPADVDAPRDRFTLVHDGASRVYRNDRVMPRAFLADEWRRLAGDDARRALRSGSFDMSRMVLLERDLPPGQMVQRGGAAPGLATVVRYESERVTIETEADAARLLVLTDTYFPGWVATVDGTGADILRANYAFRAVVVPPGRHTVEFRYQPSSFRLGAGLSVAGLLGAVLLVFAPHRGRRSRAA